MKRKTKIVLGVTGIVLFIGLVSLGIYLMILKDYRDKVAAINISDIELSAVPDGTYVGDYDVNFIYAKVEVTVQGGKITDITLLEHKNGEGEPAERIIDDIVQEQSLKVDTVSGATNSCKVILKAIDNALTGGK